MKIGDLALDGCVILAPLAGVTAPPFRTVVKACGCSLVCSEMVSAKGIVYNSGKTRSMIASVPEERPLSVQIFGACPVSMGKAAAFIERQGGADIIDINFGCSVRKVVKTGAGAALMKDRERAEAVIRAVREAVSLPVTVKIRSGWDSSGAGALMVSKIAETNGVNAVTVHPRTALQGFKGEANWRLIREVKQHVSIPVIGNGDVTTPEAGVKMMNETGCDGIMVGRAAMGNPFILSGIQALLENREPPGARLQDRFDVMERLVTAYADYYGGQRAAKMLRSRLVWFLKGFRGASGFRKQVVQIETCAQALSLVQKFGESLGAYN